MGRKWTLEEENYLSEKYFQTPMSVMMNYLNRGDKSIRSKAKKMNLRRTDSLLTKREDIYKEYNGIVYKTCSKCKREFPLNDVHFFVDKNSRSGFKASCKECEIEDFKFGDKIGLFNMRWKEMKCISGIYRITNKTTNKIYIGSAVNFCSRWSVHYDSLRKNKHENKYFQNAWNKYGAEDFIFEIIEFVENKELLLNREQYWLDFYKSYNRKIGYNILEKAGNCLGKKTSQETKEKLKRMKNKPVLQFDMYGNFIKEFISSNEAERILGHDTNGCICNCCNHKLAHAYNYIWIYKSEYEANEFDIQVYVDKLNNSRRTPQNTKEVSQYSLDGKLIKIWDSIKNASDELNLNDYNILSCCKGKTNSYAKFVWKFYDECNSESIPVKNYKGKLVYQYSEDNKNLIKVWSSITDVSQYWNKDRKIVRELLNKNTIYNYKDYIWSFKEVI